MGIFDFLRQKTDDINPYAVDQRYLEGRGFTPKQAKDILQTQQTNERRIDEAKVGYDPMASLKLGATPRQTLRDYTEGAFNLSSALVNLWSQAVQSRRDYIMISAELKRFYIVGRILNLVCDDLLNPDEEGEIVSFTSEIPEIQAELNELYDKIDFNTLLQDFVHDFINLGEYALRLEFEDGKGLKSINDDVDQLNLIALYAQGEPVNFLHFVDKDYVMEPAHRYAHFINGDEKLRVALEDQLESGYTLTGKDDLPENVKDKLPDYIRVGKPLFWGIVAKLRELQILETLIPATKLNQITQAQMVSLRVPANMPVDKVMQACLKYEDILNVPIGIDASREQLSIAEILTASGKCRVLPNFSDEKGTLEPLNVRANQPVDDILNSIKDIRSIILTSIGIPPSLVFGSDDKDKVQELRLFGQYTRRLAGLQRSLRRGFKQIIAAHLVNKNFKVSKDDFDVKFKQSLVDISGLEKLEFNDAKQEFVGRTLDFVDKLTQNKLLVSYLNPDELINYMKAQFKDLTDSNNLFNDKPNPNTLLGDVPHDPNKQDKDDTFFKPTDSASDSKSDIHPSDIGDSDNTNKYPDLRP